MLDGLDRLMVWQQNRDAMPFPDIDNPWQGGYAPGGPKNINPWQTGAAPEITIDRPRLTVQDPLLGTGQRMQQVESSLAVSIAPLTINTAIELDGTTLGRATITAQQTVVKNTGGGAGGGGVFFPIREL